MTKRELIKEIATQTGLTSKVAENFIATFMDVVKETLGKGESVKLVGFCSWEVRERKARTGVNPRTKEKISIPAKPFIKTTIGATLKNALKGEE